MRTPSHRFLGLYVYNALGFAVFQMSGPITPLYVISMGYSDRDLGLILSASMIGSLLISIPSGFLIRRFGPRNIILAAVAQSIVGGLVVYLWRSVPGLIAGLTLLEMGRIQSAIASQSLVGNLSKQGESSTSFGKLTMAAAVGQFVGPLIGGLLIDTIGYRAPWLIISFGLALSLAVCALMIPKDNRSYVGVHEKFGIKGRFAKFVSVPVGVAIAVSFLLIFGSAARFAFFPLHVERIGFSASILGALLSFRALVSLVLRGFMGKIVARAGSRITVILYCLALGAVGLITTPFCTSIVLLGLNTMLVGISIGLVLPLCIASISDHVGSEERGLAFAVRMTGNRFASMSGPFVFGIVAGVAGIGWTFIGGGIIVALTTLGLALVGKRRRLVL